MHGPKPAYTRFRLGEGRGGGSGGCGLKVPHTTTPTPDPSPAEPRYSEGSATPQSDRSRQQPTSVGGGEKALHAKLAAALPFSLTAGQQAAIADIMGDLARPERMLRLLQGDVGSGKTVVALFACAAAI